MERDLTPEQARAYREATWTYEDRTAYMNDCPAEDLSHEIEQASADILRFEPLLGPERFEITATTDSEQATFRASDDSAFAAVVRSDDGGAWCSFRFENGDALAAISRILPAP